MLEQTNRLSTTEITDLEVKILTFTCNLRCVLAFVTEAFLVVAPHQRQQETDLSSFGHGLFIPKIEVPWLYKWTGVFKHFSVVDQNDFLHLKRKARGTK